MDLTRLKRFDPAKHEQLIGLLQWCELMGLTGKDLISLGGHIDRLQVKQEKTKNAKIVESYDILPVGTDRTTENRFSIKTINGRYKFEHNFYHTVFVTSYTTKAKKHFSLPFYELPAIRRDKRWVYQTLLAVQDGTIQLNF